MSLKDQIIDTCKNFEGVVGKFGRHCIEIIENDEYRIFDIDVDIDYVIDIGCCLGEVSYACSKLFPEALILAIEPSPLNYKKASNNLKNTDIFLENLGIHGDNGIGLEIHNFRERNIGMQQTKEGGDDCISCTIHKLIRKYKIDFNKNVILKMDCEGCERFVLDDLNLCKKFYQISFEYHKHDCDKKILNNFLNEMTKTHSLIRQTKTEFILRKN